MIQIYQIFKKSLAFYTPGMKGLTFAMREKLQLLLASYDVKKTAATLEETMNVNKQRSCDRYPMSLCLSTSRSRIADQQEIKYGVTLWRC